jgi:hypothetical protein
MDSMRPKLTTVALVGLCALVLAACTETSDQLDTASEPWNDPGAVWMQPAGTPLAKGVTVPEGARLVGPVFTQFDEPRALKGELVVGRQRGYLLVDGEPYSVATDFLDQWDGENGLGDYAKDTACRQQVDEGVEGKTHNYNYKGEPAEGAVEISCSVSLIFSQRLVGEETFARAIGMSFTQDLTDPDAPVQGTVGWESPPVAIPETLPEAPEDVDGPTSVASDVDYLPDLKIVDGSFLAGPPWPGSITGGYVAVIGVTGDPDEVFDAYVAQDEDKPYLTADETVQGMRIREYKSAEAGGIWLDITLNEIDGNAWILVGAYND